MEMVQTVAKATAAREKAEDELKTVCSAACSTLYCSRIRVLSNWHLIGAPK